MNYTFILLFTSSNNLMLIDLKFHQLNLIKIQFILIFIAALIRIQSLMRTKLDEIILQTKLGMSSNLMF